MTATTEMVRPAWVPNAGDRCDRCNGESRAYTKAEKGGLQLFLCAHHTRAFETVLFESGWDLEIRIDVLEAECKKFSTPSPDSE
jgi:hypothetical protein